MSRLKKIYEEKIIPSFLNDFAIKNKLSVPRLQKVVVNVGTGKNKVNPKFSEMVAENLTAITGQKPIIRKARKAISGFKLRTGDEVGLTVTLRGDRMYDFIDKLANVALPRLRDFRGLDPKSFDQDGNFTLGIKEQNIFPEISHENIENIHGLEVSLVTNSGSKELSQKLLQDLGFPFKKTGNENMKGKE